MAAVTLPFDHDETYYVIIGCGFSAVTNHALLAQGTSGRLGGYTVLHIGDDDPWGAYYPMPMGQWTRLLTLPGFQNLPSNVGAFDLLGSDEFSRITAQEWDRLAAFRPFSYLQGKVTAIRKVGYSAYELDLEDGAVVKAAFIDVCGGPGPALGPDD